MHVDVDILDFLQVRWTKKLNLVEQLVLVTRLWNLNLSLQRIKATVHDAAGAVQLRSG